MNTSSVFHKVVRGHISGEVDKFTTFWCSVSSGLRIPKIIEIGPRLTVILKNKKEAVFFETQCTYGTKHTRSISDYQ